MMRNKRNNRNIRNNRISRISYKPVRFMPAFYCHRPDCNNIRKRTSDYCSLHRPMSKSEVDGDDCAICQVPMTGKKMSIKLPCNHVFHTCCIRRWVCQSATCPNCRSPVDASMFSRSQRLYVTHEDELRSDFVGRDLFESFEGVL